MQFNHPVERIRLTFHIRRLKWLMMTKAEKSRHFIRFLMALAMVGGSYILFSAPRDSGTPKILVADFGELIYELYLFAMMIAGLLVSFKRDLTVKSYFYLTAPILLYICWSFRTAIMAGTGLQGFWFYGIWYLQNLIEYWGYA